MRLGSLFDGSGGWPLAASICGIEPIWSSEIEKFPIETTKKNFPCMKQLGDITSIHGNAIEPVDIITSGSPCQDLSIAGKRAGLAGSRSSLFLDSIRIIREMRGVTNGLYPRFFVWENVPGAFSSNGGDDFKTVLQEIISTTAEGVDVPKPEKWKHSGLIMGNGFSVGWRVLDAQYWGVPQRRKRIFLVADLRGSGAREILFKREGLSGDFKKIRDAWEATASDSAKCIDETGTYCIQGSIVDRAENARQRGCGIREDVSYTLTTMDKPAVMAYRKKGHAQSSKDGQGWQIATVNDSLNIFDRGETRTPTLVLNDQGGQYMDLTEGKTGTLRANSGGHLPIIMEDSEKNEIAQNQMDQTVFIAGKASRFTHVNSNGIAPSLVATDYKQPQAVCGSQTDCRVRRLTPKECGRLQGFPDNWCEGIPHSDSSEYKMWGNGMALPCALYILEGIKVISQNFHKNNFGK